MSLLNITRDRYLGRCSFYSSCKKGCYAFWILVPVLCISGCSRGKRSATEHKASLLRANSKNEVKEKSSGFAGLKIPSDFERAVNHQINSNNILGEVERLEADLAINKKVETTVSAAAASATTSTSTTRPSAASASAATTSAPATTASSSKSFE